MDAGTARGTVAGNDLPAQGVTCICQTDDGADPPAADLPAHLPRLLTVR